MRASIRIFSILILLMLTISYAQQTRILSLSHEGILCWTNSQMNTYCGIEYTEDLKDNWAPAPPPFWNIPVTNSVMSVNLPLSEIEAATMFLRVVSSTNQLPNGETYDVDANGIPQFVGSDYIELDKIVRISRFRSGVGHDYSDDFESCRSMKHYFQPGSGVDWASIQIRSPVAGTVDQLIDEWAGTQIQIRSTDFPAFHFIIFHVTLTNNLSVGDSVAAGQLLGTHVGNETTSDIAVGVNTPTGWKLLSYFDVMTDSLFLSYQSRGVTKANAIITKQERDLDPLTCVGEEFVDPGNLPNWVDLN